MVPTVLNVCSLGSSREGKPHFLISERSLGVSVIGHLGTLFVWMSYLTTEIAWVLKPFECQYFLLLELVLCYPLYHSL